MALFPSGRKKRGPSPNQPGPHYQISLGEGLPPVRVTRKRIRSIRLTIKSPDDIRVSAPLYLSEEAVRAFIASKRDWIFKARDKVSAQEQTAATLAPDSLAASLGFSEADFSDGYSSRWKKSALSLFAESVARHRAFFAPGALPDFAVKGRSMKTLWGSCNRRTRTVTLNWALLRFGMDCVDYVVFHELTHFLYIHHDRNFYGYIERFMPDYKTRIRKLNESKPR